jgi:hypothetical protein
VAYASVADVKVLLQIPAEITTYDTELTGCIESADAIIDSWLLEKGLVMPSPVPRNLEDASKYFAAWLFRRRRNYQESTSSFWTEATRFFNAYVDATEDPFLESV